jgi:hypothetical protein
MKTLNTQPSTARHSRLAAAGTLLTASVATENTMITNTERTAPTRCHQIAATAKIVIAAGVIAFGAMTALAPAATADKPQTNGQIQANCKEVSGTYNPPVTGSSGASYSSCCYKDAEGKYGCDYYQDGVYTGTSAQKQGPPVSRPWAPPANNAPIQINQAPGAAPGPVTEGGPPVAPPIANGPPAADAN